MVLQATRTIAVVGMSRTPGKAAHDVPAQLIARGFTVIPVNPLAGEILGQKAYQRLAEIPVHVDLVDVFRPAPETTEIARQAVAIGAEGIWLQLGITSPTARAIALEAGLSYVEDRCIAIEARRLEIEKH